MLYTTETLRTPRFRGSFAKKAVIPSVVTQASTEASSLRDAV